MASFKPFSLKLAHINTRSCRKKKDLEISLFLRKNDIDILTMNETWLKSNFKLDIPNHTITCNYRPRRQVGGVSTLVYNYISFGIVETCFSINTNNEAITIILKESQIFASISTIYIPPAALINISLLSNIKNFADNIIMTGVLKAKHTDFISSKTDKWSITWEKALYNADLFIAENSKPTHQDSRSNTSDIVDCVISSRAIYNNLQNLFLNNNLSLDHAVILSNFSNNINKSISPPIKVKLYHKANLY